MPPPRAHETRDLIERLHSKRRRSRRNRTLLSAIGVIVVLAAIIAGVVLATGGPAGQPSGPSPASIPSVSTTARAKTATTNAALATTTTKRVTTTKKPTSSTTARTTSTISAPATSSTTSRSATKVVVIDPGHQARADYALEPIGPGSSTKKAKVSSGTASPTTGTAESEVTLAVGLKLQRALQAKGISVIMTRSTQNVDVSNIQRAQLANKAHAALTIRLHCNGSTNRSVHGLFTLYPASIKGWTDDIAVASKRAATIIQRDAIAATGAQDRGLQMRSDLTGFNWSDVPVALVEMGFMTNASEDKQLESAAYQDRIVQGLVNGVVEFLGTS